MSISTFGKSTSLVNVIWKGFHGKKKEGKAQNAMECQKNRSKNLVFIHQLLNYCAEFNHTLQKGYLIIPSLIQFGFANSCNVPFCGFCGILSLVGHCSSFCTCPVRSRLKHFLLAACVSQVWHAGSWVLCCFDAAVNGPLFWCPFWLGSFR